MARYLVSRFLQGLVVLVLVTVVVFLVSRLSGSPVNQMLPENASKEQRDALASQLGLDQSLVVQYAKFAGDLLSGDFGYSHRFQVDALQLVVSRLDDTLILATTALVIAVVLGTSIGLVAGLRKGSRLDHALMTVVTMFQSVPSFWIGILLILIIGVTFQALPFAGNDGPLSLVLPAVTLSVVPTVTIARVARSSVIETMSSDHVVTARSKGLRRGQIVRHHVLRNASVPVITMTGLMFSEAIGGAVATEHIFAWPGIGSLALEAISTRDYAVLQTITLIVAGFVVLISLAVDLIYRVADPRIRIEKRSA